MRRKKSSSSSQMESGDRQSQSHRSTGGGGGGSELFICFTSRPSAAEAPSLSASLSRRLKTSGSVKGAQSPMFSTVVGGRRNKGAAFETAEPTSPKVTCIGQVRVRGKQRRKKAKGAMLRSRSKRVVGTEASFRREGEMGRDRERECMPGARNQGWVYQIPVSICDALKAVGSEFNCLLPCSGKSFCSSSSSSKGTGEEGKVKRRGSCGAVLARWLMMQENEEVKREVEEELAREEVVEMKRKVEVVTDWEERRMVEEFEVEITKKDEILVVGEGEEEEEGKGRVSVCIPPKNALLLMRCRSDPVRMAALANRLWGSPVRKVHAEEEEVEEREEEEEEREGGRYVEGEGKAAIVGGDEGERACDASVSEETVSEAERADLKEIQAEVCEQNTVLDSEREEKDLDEPTKESLEKNGDPPCSNETEKEKDCDSTSSEPHNLPTQAHSVPVELTKEETTETQTVKEEKQSNETQARRSTSCSPSRAKEEKKQRQYRMRRQRSNGGGGSSSREKDSRRHSFSSEGDPRRSSFSSVKDGRRSSFSIEGRRCSFSIEQEDIVIAKQSEVSRGNKKSKACSPETGQDKNGDKEGENRTEEKEKEKTEEKMERRLEMIATERKKSGELPDCLLLMMYEPKLSMEVSRETWVRPTDFINWRSHKRHNHNPPPKTEDPKTEETKTEETDEQKKDTPKATQTEETADLEPDVVETLPAVLSVVKGGSNEEKNRVKIELPAEVLYAPFVLKRCKSEPMRASARLVADACFWKERHRPIGAVGF